MTTIPFHIQVLLLAVFGLLAVQSAASLVGFYTFLKTRKLLDEATALLRAVDIHAKISDRNKDTTCRAIHDLKGTLEATANDVKTTTAQSFRAVDEKIDAAKTELSEKIVNPQGDSGMGVVEMHSPSCRRTAFAKQGS